MCPLLPLCWCGTVGARCWDTTGLLQSPAVGNGKAGPLRPWYPSACDPSSVPWELSLHRSSSPSLPKLTKTSWPKRQQTLWTISDCCVSPHGRAIHHSPPHCNTIRNQQRFPSSFGIPAKWCLHGWFPSIPQLSHFLLLSQKRRLSAL